MILSTRGGARVVEFRSAPVGWDVAVPPWTVESAGGGWPGRGNTTAVPALSAGLRMIANDVSLLPLMVYRETDADGNAEKARDTWQWQLLHQQPDPETPACVFWFNIVMGMLASGGAYALKLRTKGRVAALEFMDGAVMEDEQREVFNWHRTDGSYVRGIPESNVIEFQGPSFNGGDGVSLVQHHRLTLETALAQDTFRRTSYQNEARAGLIVQHPQITTVEQAEDYASRWESRHRGPNNAGRPTFLPISATVTQQSINFEDLQFIESMKYGVEEIERILLLPPGSLQEPTRPIQEADRRTRYTQQTIAPWLARIEGVLEADPDLFGVGSGLYPEFQTAALMKADIATRYDAYLKGRQAGWLCVDDIRAAENLPPLPNGAGQIFQETPVGGAPAVQPPQQPQQAPADDQARSLVEAAFQ